MNDPIALARPQALALKAYASARSLTAPAPDSRFLDANEAPNEPGSRFNRYPEPQPEALRSRLSDIYGLSPARFLMGRGSDEAIDLLARVFCREGRDAIVVCPPTYGVYAVSAAVQGAEVLRAPLAIDWSGREPRSRLDFGALERAVASDEPRAKLVFLCAPNNPTGDAFSLDDIRRALDLASGRCLVVVDEAYAEFAGGESALSLLEGNPHLVVLRTFSKAWALAGVRMGIAAGREDVIGLLQKVRAPYPFCAPQVAAALEGASVEAERRMRARVEEIVARREAFRSWALESPLVEGVFPSAANFALAKFKDAPAALARARAAGFVLRDFSSTPGLEGCVRVSIGSESEMNALRAALEGAPS